MNLTDIMTNKRVHTIQFHLHEVLEEIKTTIKVEKNQQNRDYLGMRLWEMIKKEPDRTCMER